MPLEIERKFLIKNDSWKDQVSSQMSISQGFLNDEPDRVIRIRTSDQTGFLTIKGRMKDISRPEYEYEIPYYEACELLKMCNPTIIRKTRYKVYNRDHLWEIDIFHAENEGLSIAEIELQSEDEIFHKPDWIGREVSHEKKYLNLFLSKHPFQQWE